LRATEPGGNTVGGGSCKIMHASIKSDQVTEKLATGYRR
jgi:hypothetical protein